MYLYEQESDYRGIARLIEIKVLDAKVADFCPLPLLSIDFVVK
jgi:hypothetical protein